jgi:hypothetical protein
MLLSKIFVKWLLKVEKVILIHVIIIVIIFLKKIIFKEIFEMSFQNFFN